MYVYLSLCHIFRVFFPNLILFVLLESVVTWFENNKKRYYNLVHFYNFSEKKYYYQVNNKNSARFFLLNDKSSVIDRKMGYDDLLLKFEWTPFSEINPSRESEQFEVQRENV